MTWDAVQRALARAFTSASGLAADRVRWADQNVARPAAPFVSLAVVSDAGIGQAIKTTEDSPTPTEGEELINTWTDIREVTLSVQCFAADGVGSGAAYALLRSTIARLRLPSIRDALRRDAGIGLQFETVQHTGAEFKSAVFEPRATVRARFFYHEEASEAMTYIETADVTVEIVA